MYYWCPEKFLSGHCCKKELFFIDVNDDEEDELLGEAQIEAKTERDSVGEEQPQISIHTISGTLHCSTMKVEGVVKNKRLQLLIDSSSTHNFLDIATAEMLGCPMEEINAMKVSVRNGNVMNCNKMCCGLGWVMQGESFTTNVYFDTFGQLP